MWLAAVKMTRPWQHMQEHPLETQPSQHQAMPAFQDPKCNRQTVRFACKKVAGLGAYIVSQVHPEVQVIAGAHIIGVEVAKAPVSAAVQEEPEALHALTRWDWQPARFSKNDVSCCYSNHQCSAVQLTVNSPMTGVNKHAESKEAHNAIVFDIHVGYLDDIHMHRYHATQLGFRTQSQVKRSIHGLQTFYYTVVAWLQDSLPESAHIRNNLANLEAEGILRA